MYAINSLTTHANLRREVTSQQCKAKGAIRVCMYTQLNAQKYLTQLLQKLLF